MLSKQAILIVALLFLAIASFFIFQKIQGKLKGALNPEPHTTSTDTTQGSNSNNNNNNILGKTGQFIEDEGKKTAQNLGDLLGEKTRSTLDDILPKKNQPPKVSTIDKAAIDPKAVSTIDLAKDSTVRLNLTKNNRYYLGFANVPANYCLYIGTNKYPIPQDKNLEIEFTSSGLFPLKANACDLGDKNLGEITVE